MTYLLRIRWWLLLLLVALAPFHAFFVTWAKSMVGENNANGTFFTALTGWREVIFLIVGTIVLIELIIKKTWPQFNTLDWLILAYLALALIWLPFQKTNPTQWLLGVRFDIMPLLIYMIIKQVTWPDKNKIVKIILAFAFVVVIFGLLQALILPQDFLMKFGYSDYQGVFQPDFALSGCQYLEHTNRICRVISTFGGPTRYGTYLLLIIGLLVPFIMRARATLNKVQSFWPHVLTLLTGVSVILTFSRSIWIGLFIMGIFAYFGLVPRKIKTIITLSVVGIFILSFFTWQISSIWTHDTGTWPPKFISTVFVRSSSSSEHFALTKAGIETAITHPLGLGLGTNGPASIKFQKSLSENWFVQIAVEMGIAGFLLFCAILFVLSKKLLAGSSHWRKSKNPTEVLTRYGLFLALLGIAVAGLFTHSFEETSSVMMLMALCGMFLGTSEK